MMQRVEQLRRELVIAYAPQGVLNNDLTAVQMGWSVCDVDDLQ